LCPEETAELCLRDREPPAPATGASLEAGYARSAVLDRTDESWGARWRSPEDAARIAASVEACWSFFMGEADVAKCVRKLVDILERENLPYAVIGALALNEYGHRRVTVDVDLVMREEDLGSSSAAGSVAATPSGPRGTGKLLDTELNVNIDVFSTGRYPGDDKPKPIAFPDPATTAIRGAPFALLPIERWIELTLASGMVAPHR
jgi:hypothetical protein